MTDMNKTELLAPAGSYEAFEAALGAGADAVYVGGPDFGARAYAKNFTQEELIRAVRTAHSCKYADGCYRTEGNAVSGAAGSNPCGSCP